MAEKKSLGFLIDDVYLQHDPGRQHPESPARLVAIQKALAEYTTLDRFARVAPRAATQDEIALVHRPQLIERVEQAARSAPTRLDPDTVVSAQSYTTAVTAVGGVLESVEAILSNRLKRVFAFVRPPGHHAERGRAMGFCLFNNVAIGAAHAARRHGLERIAIIDIDVHHGNGTQEIYYSDPSVLYVSTHQFPYYPGTGNFDEVGTGDGKGYTVNLPVPQGTGDDTFVPLYERIVGPILEAYRPQLVLVSAGFDAYVRDPLGGLTVTSRGYAAAAAVLIRAAVKSAEGRICFILEGGYSAEGLQACSRAVLEQLERTNDPVGGPGTTLYTTISEQARAAYGDVWKW